MSTTMDTQQRTAFYCRLWLRGRMHKRYFRGARGACYFPHDAKWFCGLLAILLQLTTCCILAGEPGSTSAPGSTLRPHERWIWIELIGFNNESADLGVGDYLDSTGFTPIAICLLIGSPDFVLSHAGIEAEQHLPAEYCSRAGHEFNQERKRQDWTNHQLRSLIQELHVRDVEVFLSTFATYSRDPTHREWITDHREVLHVHKNSGYAWALNCLSRLDDGSYFEDYFAHKMVETLQDYGFDGWHGADGWGPLSGPIHDTSYADDMIDQFAMMPGLQLPKVVTQECIYDVPKLSDTLAFSRTTLVACRQQGVADTVAAGAGFEQFGAATWACIRFVFAGS